MHIRALLAVGVLATTWTIPLESQDGTSRPATTGRSLSIVIGGPLYDELGDLAATATQETVRCLIGVVVGDTLLLEIAWEPRIIGSTPNSVRYGGCPRATVAKWHNHPPNRSQRPEEVCYLSSVDIQDGLVPGAPLLQFVQVDRDVMCWWHRGQLRTAPRADVLHAMPGQRTGRGLRDMGEATHVIEANSRASRRR